MRHPHVAKLCYRLVMTHNKSRFADPPPVERQTDAFYMRLNKERRAKLLGLDMPAKTASTDPTGEREVLLLGRWWLSWKNLMLLTCSSNIDKI